MKTFNDSALDKKLLKTLSEIGYKKPTQIQKLAIPKAIEGCDLIASAATGTGKTAAFILPALNMLIKSPLEKNKQGPRVLVLVPTRELAIQVADAAKKYSQNMPNVTTVCIYGGVPYPLQRKLLSRPYDILVATPGRLIDQMDNGRINLSEIKTFVLDEADRMLDMGFVEPVKKISRRLPNRRQTLLFSATLDKKIQRISDSLQKDPYQIETKMEEKDKPKIDQRLYYVDNWNHKMKLLDHLLEDTAIEQAIVFTSTKIQADDLAHELKDKGFRTEALHGDIRQRQRTKTIDRLRQGKTKFLVATDVAARGIDIPQLSHVFNVDLPYQEEDYVHRIGRTGRAGSKGTAVTFATYRENNRVVKIQKSFGSLLSTHTIEGLEPKPKGAIKSKSSGRSRSSGGSAGRSRSSGGFDGRSRSSGGSDGRSRSSGGSDGRSRSSGGFDGRSRSSGGSDGRSRSSGGFDGRSRSSGGSDGRSRSSGGSDGRSRSSGGSDGRSRSSGGSDGRSRSSGGSDGRSRSSGGSDGRSRSSGGFDGRSRSSGGFDGRSRSSGGSDGRSRSSGGSDGRRNDDQRKNLNQKDSTPSKGRFMKSKKRTPASSRKTCTKRLI